MIFLSAIIPPKFLSRWERARSAGPAGRSLRKGDGLSICNPHPTRFDSGFALSGSRFAARRPLPEGEALFSELLTNDLCAVSKRVQFHLRNHARQRLHSAIGAKRDSLWRDCSDDFADACRNLFRRFDGVRAYIQDAD